MRPEITEDRIMDPAKGFCPGFEAGNRVYADAQNLGI